jgi:hypothetical protein
MSKLTKISTIKTHSNNPCFIKGFVNVKCFLVSSQGFYIFERFLTDGTKLFFSFHLILGLYVSPAANEAHYVSQYMGGGGTQGKKDLNHTKPQPRLLLILIDAKNGFVNKAYRQKSILLCFLFGESHEKGNPPKNNSPTQ